MSTLTGAPASPRIGICTANEVTNRRMRGYTRRWATA